MNEKRLLYEQVAGGLREFAEQEELNYPLLLDSFITAEFSTDLRSGIDNGKLVFSISDGKQNFVIVINRVKNPETNKISAGIASIKLGKVLSSVKYA